MLTEHRLTNDESSSEPNSVRILNGIGVCKAGGAFAVPALNSSFRLSKKDKEFTIYIIDEFKI